MVDGMPPSGQKTDDGSRVRSLIRLVIVCSVMICISFIGGLGYMFWKNQGFSAIRLTASLPKTPLKPATAEPSGKSRGAEVRLTRDEIDKLLDELDRANREKDIDRIIRMIAPDAAITIHMKQGTQVQSATLTRDDYRKTLSMAFAFPSGNDFARTNTSVSVASDERTAKVSFKSSETLRQVNRELKAEGEEILVFSSRDGKVVITSLEHTVPGDSM